MDTSQITQIVEAIKTLNININDATTQKIADAIIPVVKMYLIKNYVYMGLTFIGVMTFLVLSAWLIKKAIESENK